MTIPEPTFLVLTALADRPLHGYGVMLAVRELSNGRLNLRPGTLYTTLDRLADDGWLAVECEEAVDGQLRRYYRLTDRGAAAFAIEVARSRANATVPAAAQAAAPAARRRGGAVGLAMVGVR
jgi:DNA-binding PadR family transcriptional regulator